jgi:23S rRNA (cytosine1962-C5)-methyltransferase
MAGVIVRPRARIFHGHDWVYLSEVLKTFGEPQPGDVISLRDGRDRFLGSAIYNPHSQIVARRISRRKQDLDLDFLVRRIALAISTREKLGARRNPGRLVASEADGLPGLIIDQYLDHIVVQTLTLAMDQRKGLILDAVKSLLQPSTVIERNDVPIRKAEGLPQTHGILFGENPGPIEISLDQMRMGVDLVEGHKTGFYLDQIDNYRSVARYAPGRAVLDCFSNQGGFGIACALAGATSVTAVEINDALATAIGENALRNHVHVATIAENAFDFLTQGVEEGRRFELIVLDPPSFTKSKESLKSAWRGYKEIHRRALQMLEPDGMLVTFSCSHHVSREMLLQVVVEAGVDANRHVRVLQLLTQPLDHPVLPHLPETEYLKGFILQVLPGR